MSCRRAGNERDDRNHPGVVFSYGACVCSWFQIKVQVLAEYIHRILGWLSRLETRRFI